MVQDIVDPLAAEALLAEMLCQNGGRHFLQIAHFVDGDSAADYFFHIRRCNSFCCPHLIPTFFLFIMLIQSGNNLLRMI